jgi:ORF6N domain
VAGRVLLPTKGINVWIVTIRGLHVMFDADLAELYGVSTKVLVQAVKRNRSRFPPDFMFRLTALEFQDLRSQIVTSSSWGGRRTAPYAFNEQGVAMLSGVLRSTKAIKANIEIMRAFVRLRRLVISHADLAKKLEALEAKYDDQFVVVFKAIRELMAAPTVPRKRIGFGH